MANIKKSQCAIKNDIVNTWKEKKTHEKCHHVFCFYLYQILHQLLPKIWWSRCSIISFSLLSLGVNNESILWPLKSSPTLTLMFRILNIKFAYSLDKSSHFEHHFHASYRVANLPMIYFCIVFEKSMSHHNGFYLSTMISFKVFLCFSISQYW
jgi:hypothetical protein